MSSRTKSQTVTVTTNCTLQYCMESVSTRREIAQISTIGKEGNENKFRKNRKERDRKSES